MSPPDALLPRERSSDAPLFAEAWHAEALAIASALTRSGMFSAGEWSEALGAALRASAARHEPDDEEHYYEAVLAALESLVGREKPAVAAALATRIEDWRRAYVNTPHGQPVELAAAHRPPAHDHHHRDHDDHDHR